MIGKVKFQVTLGGAVRQLIDVMAELHFEGSASKAVEHILYASMSRTLKESTYFTEAYFNLPSYHEMKDIKETQSGVLMTHKYTLYIDGELILWMEGLAKGMDVYADKNGIMHKVRQYPQFKGLKRNVVYQAAYNYMFDITMDAINAKGGQTHGEK